MDAVRQTVAALLVVVSSFALRFYPPPSHPAPSLKIVAATAGAPATSPVHLLRRAADDDDTTDWTELALVDGAILHQRGTDKTVLVGIDPTTDSSLVVRLTAAGAIDSTFGDGAGFVEIDGVPAWGAAVAVGADDRITIAVASPGGAASTLVRLDRDGARDASFGDDGATPLPDGVLASAIAVAADDSIAVGRWTANATPTRQTWRVLRVDATGRVDAHDAATVPACTGVESGIERIRVLADGRVAADAWCSSAGGGVHVRTLTLPSPAAATADAGLLPIR